MAEKVFTNEEKIDELLTSSVLAGISSDSLYQGKTLSPDIVGNYLTIQPNGDMIIGDYNGGQGILWDQSLGILSILGGLSVDHLDIPDTITADSFHVNAAGDAWWGAAAIGGALAKILKTGDATFTNIDATGTINATGGYVGTATAIVYEATGMNCGTTGHMRGGQTDYLTGVGWFIGYTGGAYKLSVGDPGGDYMAWNGTNLIINGSGLGNNAGNTQLFKWSVGHGHTSAGWEKSIEVICGDRGTFRILFQATIAAAETGYARIYRNGSAVGTLQTLPGGGGWGSWEEDIAGWKKGDLLQIYSHSTAGAHMVTIGDGDGVSGALRIKNDIWTFSTY